MSKHLLVVDDNKWLLHSFVDNFTGYGLHVRVVSNARRAIELLREDYFDAVLTDMDMPGMDGLALTRAIQKEFPQIKVLLMTGADMEDSVQQALSEGAAGIFYKGEFGAKEIAEFVLKH